MVPSNSPTIHPKSGDSASHQPISTAVINFAETSATLPKFQILEDISINEHQINNNLVQTLSDNICISMWLYVVANNLLL